MKFFGISLAVSLAFGLPEKLTTNLELALSEKPWSPLANLLSDVLPTVSIPTLLSPASLDHEGYTVAPTSPLVQELHFTNADDRTMSWYPQGVTSSADSQSTGGTDAILTSWYTRITKGVRIGFHDPTTNHYVYALLVEPTATTDGSASFKAMKGLHAGGIMWYGTKLYVVDTSAGIRIFDMSKILKVTVGSGIGKNGDTYTAHKYKYIIPQTALYQTSATFRYSWISLDRTSSPHSLLVGEYQPTGTSARIARFSLDEETAYLSAAKRTEIWRIGKTSIQGGISIDGTYFFTKSHDVIGKSELLKWDGSAKSEVVSLGRILPPGAEDLSYWKEKDQLWSLAEHAWNRKLYALKASSL